MFEKHYVAPIGFGETESFLYKNFSDEHIWKRFRRI